MNHMEGMKATGGRGIVRDWQRHNGYVCVYGWVCDGCVFMGGCVCLLRLLMNMKTAHPCSEVSHYCSYYSAEYLI